ncbi:hypothetical protein [Nocardia tengchongensis]|uniref:hypothetical protein n=1 Tax=Nocardia tengchongensis TaxID=2055889 RepID=UPI00368C4B73
MWNWSKHQADRAVAASFTAWRHRDPEPTVTDPEFDEEGGDQAGNTAVAGYADTPDGACTDISEDTLAGLFDALSAMLQAGFVQDGVSRMPR